VTLLPTRRAVLGAGLALGLGPTAMASAEVAWPANPVDTIELWPGLPPGAPSPLPVQQLTDNGNRDRPSRLLRGVARPFMKVFRPARPNGAALLVTPGGGYSVIVVDAEGYQIGPWLQAREWTVFVLYYRLPGEGWANRANVPLADAQRAMRVIRSRASEYAIDPERVGALGFSAGGHVCGDLATRHTARVYTPVDAADRLSARPRIAAPIYAVQSMSSPLAHRGSRDALLGPAPTSATERRHSPAHNVSVDTPPMFLAHAEDDEVVASGNTLAMREALIAARVPVETHLFAAGGHGFGLPGPAGEPARHWPELFALWARAQGLG
jgi:acetyl esterase/lipase